ncbi:MAG: manganese efflux pump MntP family protein [Phycisphaerae bacterium]|nr:manganese efflux pump MntP family protein [Phycisphaerae bacterium]
MELPAIIAIAMSLAMDAFAVSVVTGAAYKELHIRHTLRMAMFFGGFQAFMPAVGYLAGLTVRQYISDYDHWIAFAILAAVGLKMIYESFKIKSERRAMHPANLAMLLALAVATSIDALAVGITLSLITSSIIAAIIIIGVVTFVLSCVGVTIGKRFGHFFESGIEAFGGLVLIGIGVKILIQHLFF